MSEVREPGTPGGTTGEDNVVAFTGNWFGPVEELVPIGRAPDPEPEEPGVIGAGDFWGEDSASLHEAIALPDVEVPAVAPAPVDADADPAEVARAREPRRPRELLTACAAAVAVIAATVAWVGLGAGQHRPGLSGVAPGRLVAEVARDGHRAIESATAVIGQVGADRAIRATASRRSPRSRVVGRMHRTAGRAAAVDAATSTPSVASTHYAATPSYASSTAPPPSSSSARRSPQTSSPSAASLLGPGRCSCE